SLRSLRKRSASCRCWNQRLRRCGGIGKADDAAARLAHGAMNCKSQLWITSRALTVGAHGDLPTLLTGPAAPGNDPAPNVNRADSSFRGGLVFTRPDREAGMSAAAERAACPKTHKPRDAPAR